MSTPKDPEKDFPSLKPEPPTQRGDQTQNTPEVGSAAWLELYAESERIERIAQDATEAAWHKVNHRIISFESFEKAIKPEILKAISVGQRNENQPVAPVSEKGPIIADDWLKTPSSAVADDKKASEEKRPYRTPLPTRQIYQLRKTP